LNKLTSLWPDAGDETFVDQTTHAHARTQRHLGCERIYRVFI